MYLYGNTSANIMNSGTALECPFGIFYIGPNFNVYRKVNGRAELFMSVKARYLNCYKNYLYYTNEHGEICRILEDKSAPPEKLVSLDCACVNIMNDDIYFRNLSDNKKLYTCKINGTNIMNVCDETALFLNAYQGKLYFCDATTYHLYSCNVDGSGLKMLSDHRIYYPNLTDGRIIYSDKTLGGNIFSMNLDGADICSICTSVEAYYLNVYRQTAYFRNYLDGYTLWACEISTGKLSKLIDENIFHINSTSEGLYFCKKNEGGKICHLDMNMS